MYQAAINTATFLRLDILFLHHLNMLFTGLAVVWLGTRAWQTLRKPVPDLINILGVDVPDPPDVSLAGIRADAATLTWTRPRANRPVAKFLIQVNGVNVGESASQETAITVTGLKPNHFYNIRVIAVGNNNFQAGSRVIRLRTFAKSGHPELGNGRVPSNFAPEQPHVATAGEVHNDEGIPRSPGAGVESISVPESSVSSPPNAGPSGPGLRRNTLTRKHSPSTTSLDSQAVKEALSRVPEESVQKLGDRFESIHREAKEIQAQIAKDQKEHRELMEEMAEEKKSKRRILKEKDETTEKLKRELGSTDRAMRSAQQKKTQMEKRLREKQNERKKLQDDIAKWDKEMTTMSKRQGGFEEEKEALWQEADDQIKEIQVDIEALQLSLAGEEAELKEKSKELKEAEDQRKKLPGGEDSDQWQEQDRQMRRDWESKFRDLNRRLIFQARRARALDENEEFLRRQLATTQQSGLNFSQANSSGVDFDIATQTQFKRRSRNSNSLPNGAIPSPATTYSMTDRTYTSSSGFGLSRPPTIPPGFAQAPFLELNDFTTLDEDGIRALTASAPLSPTAAQLLPADILNDLMDDDDPPSPASRPTRHNTFSSAMSLENDPQSPVSSGRSISIISSPRSSSQHLPFSQYTGENSERRSLRGEFAASSPSAPPAHASRFTFPWLHRGHKPADEPPALGSLKSAHSQSFPRQTDDAEAHPNRRRISFSSGWNNMFNRNSAGSDFPEMVTASSGVTSRRPGLFAHMNSGSSMLTSDRDPSSPRPVSIASSDFPRPSTDSGSIWNKPSISRSIWPLDVSRSVSRRPSTHGSPAALKTTLADADDEILDESEMRQPPASVGVIGTKPSKSLGQRLNPAAPSFTVMRLFRTKDKDSKDHKEKEKNKARPKEKDRDTQMEKTPRESLTSASEATDTPSIEDSPSESRKSRDAFSAYTASVSESRESLSLDQAMSNTPSELAVGHSAESGLKKLLRKGSSSRFSLSSIRGVGGKKGPSSVANSDKNASLERTSVDLDEHPEDGAVFGRSYDSLNSSPGIGPLSAGKQGKEKWSLANRLIKKKPNKEKESLELEYEETMSFQTSMDTVTDESKA